VGEGPKKASRRKLERKNLHLCSGRATAEDFGQRKTEMREKQELQPGKKIDRRRDCGANPRERPQQRNWKKFAGLARYPKDEGKKPHRKLLYRVGGGFCVVCVLL